MRWPMSSRSSARTAPPAACIQNVQSGSKICRSGERSRGDRRAHALAGRSRRSTGSGIFLLSLRSRQFYSRWSPTGPLAMCRATFHPGYFPTAPKAKIRSCLLARRRPFSSLLSSRRDYGWPRSRYGGVCGQCPWTSPEISIFRPSACIPSVPPRRHFVVWRKIAYMKAQMELSVYGHPRRRV